MHASNEISFVIMWNEELFVVTLYGSWNVWDVSIGRVSMCLIVDRCCINVNQIGYRRSESTCAKCRRSLFIAMVCTLIVWSSPSYCLDNMLDL